MITATIKRYAFFALGLLAVAAGARWRYVEAKNDELKAEARVKDARIDHHLKVMEADKEIEEQADDRLVDAVKEISEDGAADELSDPNDW